MILLENPYVTISINKEGEYLHQKWTGFCPGKDLRMAIDVSMKILEEYNIFKIISDVKEQKVVSPNDQKYIKEKVLDFLKVNKCFKQAFVTKKKTVVTTCITFYERALQQENSNGIIEIFNNLKDAEEWIRGKK